MYDSQPNANYPHHSVGCVGGLVELVFTGTDDCGANTILGKYAGNLEDGERNRSDPERDSVKLTRENDCGDDPTETADELCTRKPATFRLSF